MKWDLDVINAIIFMEMKHEAVNIAILVNGVLNNKWLKMINRIKEVIAGLNYYKEQYLKKHNYTNEAFFKDGVMLEPFNLKEKRKYFYIDEHTSGIFMVDKNSGLIFRIKAYGQINTHKIVGNINTVDTKELWLKRWW